MSLKHIKSILLKLCYVGVGSGYWIDPAGKIYDIKDDSHWEWANKEGHVQGDLMNSNAEMGNMVNRGWIRVRNVYGGLAFDVRDISRKTLEDIDDFMTFIEPQFETIAISGVSDEPEINYRITKDEFEENNHSVLETIQNRKKTQIV